MLRKETYQEKLDKLAKEYDRKQTNEEWIKERLQWEDWETVSKEATAIARRVLRGWRWRRGEVLPRGYDAESIASQVMSDMLQGKGRIAPGWTRERLTKELERLIRGKIRLLESLKESAVTDGEWKVNGEGEHESILEDVPGESATGDEAITARERQEHRKQLMSNVVISLADEPEAAAVFKCRCEGMTNPEQIAQHLGMDVAAVIRVRKKLDRRLAKLRKSKGGIKESV